MPALISVLRGGDPGVQEHAAAALASISALRESHKAIMEAKGAVMSLVTLLNGSASDETATNACLTLANLADRNANAQRLIARAGAIPLLMGLLDNCRSEEAVATALRRLLMHGGGEDNRAEAVKLGCIAQLIKLLTVIHVETQAQAAWALSSLVSGAKQDTSNRADNKAEKEATHLRKEIAKAGGLPPLLALIESKDLHALQSSLHALGMVAMNCRENQDAIATMGGTDPLVQLCSAVIPPEVQTEAVFALTELARHNPENQSGIADTGAIRPLVMLMQKSKVPMSTRRSPARYGCSRRITRRTR